MDSDALAGLDLAKPGNWIAGEDRGWAGDTLLVLSLVEGEYERAVAAFAMFEPLAAENAQEAIRNPPNKYERCLNQIYARAFVLSLDAITKLLEQLADVLQPPQEVQTQIDRYIAEFGYLRHMRNSIAHIEHRGRGQDRHQRRIEAPVIVLGGFNERRYEFTGEDGAHYNVDISRDRVLAVRDTLQALLDAYQWQ